MVIGIFNSGSGLGNMLHRYVATRVLALDKGYDFSMIAPENFKGKGFIKLDMGNPKGHIMYITEQPSGKCMPANVDLPYWEEWDKHCYDPDINFVEDNTIIDGNFEDERYFEHRLPEIKEWLKTPEIKAEDDVCIIGFRGGEYYSVPELGLPLEYYERAMTEMRKINPKMRFQVHTDDPQMAIQWFPGLECIQDIEKNWQSVRWAKYAIIANSSFYVLPRLLNGGLTIAPCYWNRYNTKKWDYPQGFYKKFQYI